MAKSCNGACKTQNGIVNLAFEKSVGDTNAENKKKKDAEDPYAVGDIELEETKTNPLVISLKICCVLFLLYVFICSLDFMGTAFRLVSGKATGAVFQNKYIQNPVVGLMIGILATVLVQSSSTSTSIIVSMVNAQILFVEDAIFMIMGSNIGTSVTNTIVSLTQIGDRNEFRRAFAGATVHDMFNWLTVITLTVVEIPTQMLYRMSTSIVNSLFAETEKREKTKIKILKHITEPFTKYIIQIDKKVITGWSENDPEYENKTLNPCYNAKMEYPNDTEIIKEECDFVFAMFNLDDTKSGIILLIISLALLCTALILIVKILKSLLKGTIANIIKRVINADIPYVPWLTGYIAILLGAVLTFIVQSSSIFTSTLTPLIGLGLITVERSYPLTLGSNIGTTTTALLASVAGEGLGLKRSVQIALVHLFFNIFGIMLFYPIPFMRWPIPMAKFLGNTTAKYRWFAMAYLILMFFLLPTFIFVLSLAGNDALYGVGLPIIILSVLVAVVNLLQNYRPKLLPTFLRSWDFLPLPLRSLEPYDRVITAALCCAKFRASQQEDQKQGVDNPCCDCDFTSSKL